MFLRIPPFLLVSLLACGLSFAAAPAPDIFDAHIHYNKDVWEPLPVPRVLELLSEAGITRALVSSTPTEGTERLYKAAPGRVVPFLRPYPTPAHRYTWFKDPDIPGYLRRHLRRIPYRGIGEFHLSGVDAHSQVVRDIVALARERALALQAHTDPEGIQALLALATDVPVIWAHSGFDVPEATLRGLLGEHENLYLELSFREGITEVGQLTVTWRALFMDFPKRFLLGMDTYRPGRWFELAQLATDARAWLGQLPDAVATDIAYRNAARLFPTPE